MYFLAVVSYSKILVPVLNCLEGYPPHPRKLDVFVFEVYGYPPELRGLGKIYRIWVKLILGPRS